jgi:hypothetical protein
MHNLGNQFFQGELETGSHGYELSPEFEFENEYNQEYSSGETGYELSPEFEFESSQYESPQYESPQYEVYEMQLAQELMEVSNEAEFLDWLKNTAKKAAGVASNFLDSPTGQKATTALTNIAQKTLPSAGATAGGFLGKKGGEALGGAIGGLVGPGGAAAGKAAGAWAGGKLGTWGGQKAGQWAADRFPSFVRFATDTVRNLANEVQSGRTPSVKPAIIKAATKHYPIILQVKGTLSATRVNNGGMKGRGSGMGRGTNGEFEFSNEYNNEGQYEYEGEGEISNQEGTFNEVTEMELASELLSLNSEAELDQFLGKLFKKIGSGFKKVMGGPLGGMLKGIAKKVLPMAGAALGSVVPGIGTAIGGAVGSAASNLFELELEGLSAEDREFETARAYVRFAGNAAKRASRMKHRNPRQAARIAIINAARRYAPGLLISTRNTSDTYSDGADDYNYDGNGNGNEEEITRAPSGTWYRQGNKIVLQ